MQSLRKNKPISSILLKVFLSVWIMFVVLVSLSIFGSNEMKYYIRYVFPRFYRFISSWLIPLLTAPYQG